MSRLDPFPWQPPAGALPWLPAGISGVGRDREWDAVQVVDLDERAVGLDASSLADLEELRLYVFADGVARSPEPVPEAVLAALARRAAMLRPPPIEARCLRRDDGRWTLGVRSSEVVRSRLEIAPGLHELGLAVLAGETTVTVDGEVVDVVDPALIEPIETIVRLARTHFRYQDFAAHAERIGLQEWAVAVDPL